jgi:hypothetical protein
MLAGGLNFRVIPVPSADGKCLGTPSFHAFFQVRLWFEFLPGNIGFSQTHNVRALVINQLTQQLVL